MSEGLEEAQIKNDKALDKILFFFKQQVAKSQNRFYNNSCIEYLYLLSSCCFCLAACDIGNRLHIRAMHLLDSRKLDEIPLHFLRRLAPD